MRGLIIFAAAVIVGCAPTPSLQELEAEAEVTGDWTEVERYERALARRAARQGPMCPTGQVSFCESYLGSEQCRCVDGDRMRALLIGR